MAVGAAVFLGLLFGFVGSGRADPSPPYYGPAVLATPGLQAYWPLDETSGTTASDQATSPADGTYHGGVTLGGTGAIQTSTDYAPTFDGSSGYVSTAAVSKLQPSTSASLEAWFKTSATGTQQIFSSGSSLAGLELLLVNGHLRGAADGGVVDSSALFDDGIWHYAVVTWDGSSVRLYADGSLVAPAQFDTNPTSTTGSPSYGTTGVSIGANDASGYPPGYYFDGSIDEAALYGSNTGSSAALSPGEVANHYADAMAGLVATPVAVEPPAVSGRPLVGSTYTVTGTGSWNDSTNVFGSLGFSYQWLRCGYGGSACTSISGATGSSYTVTSADKQHALAVRVTASNSGGSGSVTVKLRTIGGYRTAVFSDGGSSLHGYWPLDDTHKYAYGQPALDISDNPASATYKSSTYQAGVTLNQTGALVDGNDHAATFDGSSGYASTASVSKLQPSASASLEAWFKTTASGTQWILSSGSSLSGLNLLLLDGHLRGAADGGVVDSDALFNDGAWHYAVVTWDGSSVTLYADGAPVAPARFFTNPTSTSGSPSYNSTGVFVGGGSGGGYNFAGSIDEAALYGSNSDSSAALTATEVASHYALGLYERPKPSASWGGWNPAEPGACNCHRNAGDPVSTSNGDFFESATDASVAGYGPPLVFTRTYDASLAQAESQAGTPGPLGYGWTDNWDMSLSISSSGVVTVNQADGAQADFYPPSGGACQAPYVGPGGSGTYCALPAVTASLTFDSGSSTYTFITHPYQSYTFDGSGRLVGEAGPGEATLSLSYNTPAPGSGDCPGSAASCTTVTSASGRALVIASDSSSRVTKVTDPLGRSWSYSYCSPPSSSCSANDLVSVSDPLGRVTSYTYDQGNANAALKHDLLTITKPNGQPGGPDAGDALVNTYNGSGQVSSQTDPAGNQTSFDYTHLDGSTGNGYVLATDPDGNQTQYSYTNGILVSRTLGYGASSPSTWTYQPDPATLQVDATTDPNGNETDYTYNSNGDLTTKTNALGAVWSYSYNSFDEQTCATLPLSADHCDGLSPPAAIPAGSSTISPPSSAPPKYVSYSEYDTDGNPIWTTSGDYNPGDSSASQSRTSYQLFDGQSVSLGSSNDSCDTSAPDSSLPCARIDPNGVVTQLGYDSSGDLTSSATPDGNTGGELATTTYGYDADGELTSITAPEGNLTGADAATYTTTSVYNAGGELTSKTVSHTEGGITARTTSYGYDGNGNQTSVTDPRNKTTTYTYSPDDQLTLVSDPDSQQTLTCYDGDGHIAETVPAVGVAANNLTPASCPSSYPTGYGNRLADDATTYSYDPLGDRTTITTPAPAGQSGHDTTTNVYDVGGRLTSTTAPPASNDTGAPNQVTTYTYDDADQLASLTSGSGTSAASTTSYCYDPNGEKTATVQPDGNTSGLTSCSDSAPYQTSSTYQTGYSYDSLGEVVSETRPATTAAPSGQTTTYTYDPAGNLLTSQGPNGVTTTNTYTPLDQLASVSFSGSSAHAVSYGYDANGNRVAMSDASGNSSYQYDPFNELTSSQNGAGQTLTSTYNPDGQTSGITYPLGAGASWATSDTVSYGYDDAGLLTSISDFNGNTITIGNTADGLPNSLSLGSSGDTMNTSYDATDTPSDISLGNGSSSLLEFAYSNVPSGAISSETTTPSTPTSPAGYTYDPQNRVTQLTPGGGSPLNYSFDASGNLTTLPTGASGSYDNASELTSSTLAGTTTGYTYDSDGQRTQATQGATTLATATYNGAQELTSYSNTVANMSAATYDGDGLRTSTTTTPAGGSATTQNYLWDTSSSTPQLLMDSTNAYIYGPGIAPLEQVNLSDGTLTYLVTDRLGSARGTVNAAGTLTTTTSYDTWGNPQTTGGLTSNTPFGYAGNYTDPTGLTYNIRRYYDPATGQFLNVDPAVDQTEAAYAYVNGDPVNATDALGLGCGFFSPGKCLDDVTNAVGAGANTLLSGAAGLNPWSTSNPIRQWAASGSWTADILLANPAYLAVSGYAKEAAAYESGCSLWTVAKYGAEGAAGVALTGLAATGGAALVTGQRFGDIAFQSRLIGAGSRLFGNGSLVGRPGFSGLLNPGGKGLWRIGWSVRDDLPTFRINTPWKPHIDLFGASRFWR